MAQRRNILDHQIVAEQHDNGSAQLLSLAQDQAEYRSKRQRRRDRQDTHRDEKAYRATSQAHFDT